MAGSLGGRALAECVGTALLVAAIVGSGIMASRLSPGNVGLELFENAVATGAVLVAIILAVGPVSGAHLNPVITLVDRMFHGVSSVAAATYIVAQIAGAVVGAVIANLMFSLPAVEVSTRVRTGGGLWLGEVATFGLALVVFGVVRSGRSGLAPFAVGAYITGAYFFSSSTSFANPRSGDRAHVHQHLRRHRALLGRAVHRIRAVWWRHRRGGHLDPLSGRRGRRPCSCRAAPLQRSPPNRAGFGQPANAITAGRVTMRLLDRPVAACATDSAERGVAGLIQAQ
jgi:arsenate reductase